MATYLQNLITRRDKIAAELAVLDSTKAGGKPNALRGSGSDADHQGYIDNLMDQLEKLNKAIAKAEDAEAGADGDIGYHHTTFYPRGESLG